MLKYLSVLTLVIILAWSFFKAHEPRPVSMNTHQGLVTELKSIMTEFLSNNVEGIQNIKFHRFFTEVIEPGKAIAAYVKYSYEATGEDGEVTRQTREGQFELVSSDKGQSWQSEAKNFRELNLEFLQGLRISPNESN